MLSRPVLPLIFIGLIGHASTSVADPVDATSQWTNTSKATLVALRAGKQTIAILPPGETIPVVDGGASVDGRFKVDEWLNAGLKSDRWLPFHLRTAGHFLDAIDPGKPGDPLGSANLMALKKLPVSYLDEWNSLPSDWKCLLARASRHASEAFIAKLVSLVDPRADDANQCQLASQVGGVVSNVEAAIESNRPSVTLLNALQQNPTWLDNRGLANQFLLAALGLKKPIPATHSNPKTWLKDLSQALNLGQEQQARAIAVQFASQPNNGPGRDILRRMSCSVLDSAAASTRRKNQWLATDAYLRLAIKVCGDKSTIRDRIAQYYRARAEKKTAALDLMSAADWLTAAFWIARDPNDKAFLADTWAELAILRFRTEDNFSGRLFLNYAQDLDPLRSRVLAAAEFNPETDPRARVGVAIVIFFLAVFSWRRLKRVLFGDLSR
ncbi:MAG: hypothetical protein CMH52_03625 [Myxococcales bacterium]|nr:hypothetical protein [Myxococcales bacterium]